MTPYLVMGLSASLSSPTLFNGRDAESESGTEIGDLGMETLDLYQELSIWNRNESFGMLLTLCTQNHYAKLCTTILLCLQPLNVYNTLECSYVYRREMCVRKEREREREREREVYRERETSPAIIQYHVILLH